MQRLERILSKHAHGPHLQAGSRTEARISSMGDASAEQPSTAEATAEGLPMNCERDPAVRLPVRHVYKRETAQAIQQSGKTPHAVHLAGSSSWAEWVLGRGPAVL